MERLVFGKKFYSMGQGDAEKLFHHIKNGFYNIGGKYYVLGDSSIDENDREPMGIYLEMLIALGLVDSVLDEKLRSGNDETTLASRIESLKCEITELLGHY